MKYVDFSSLVQLGVGLHVGTALLQAYGDVGAQPLLRTVDRIKSSLNSLPRKNRALADRLDKLEGDIEIFKVQFFKEYVKYIVANTLVAFFLLVFLVVISYRADATISVEFSVIVVALSILPAPYSLFCLWLDSNREMRPLKKQADELEADALRAP